MATYYKRKALHEREAAALRALPYIYTFDTSLPNLTEQVDEAATKIEKRLSQIKLNREVE
ncbi:MAG: hypothetical protein ACREGF_05765 [Candidatus Saccharimonadales bacterium]